MTQVRAERRRHTKSEQTQMERQARRNERFRSKPVEIKQQPKKQRTRYVGYVVFEWETGPKAGKRYNSQITLRDQARLKIRGRDLIVMPRDGDEYVWGEKDPNPQIDPKKQERLKKPGKPAGEREMRLRDAIQAKFDEFLEERGPHGAGKAMALCFVKAHNKLDKKIAKISLAKVYKSVLMHNKAAFLAFARAVKNSAALKKQVDVDKKDEAMKKNDRVVQSSLSSADQLEVARVLRASARVLYADAADKKAIKKLQSDLNRVVQNLLKTYGDFANRSEAGSAAIKNLQVAQRWVDKAVKDSQNL